MGLDQYAFTRRTADLGAVDFPQEDSDVELFYWRKHANLQGWMQALYNTKGGTEEDFNGPNVQITAADLDKLEAELDDLPTATGFFWGTSDETDKVKDIEFIRLARAAIADGLSVYYSSWY